MKVVLIGNHPLEKMESMHRYANMLYEGLTVRGVNITTIRPLAIFGRIKFSSHGVGKWLGYLDKFIVFPFFLLFKSIEDRKAIFHICDHSNAMYCLFIPWVKTVVTCHDILAIRSALGHFKENPVGRSGKLLQKWITAGLRRTDFIVSDSKATQNQLMELSISRSSQVKTIYLGLNREYAPMDPTEARTILVERENIHDLPEQGYLLHVGGHGWYKNRIGLLRIYFNYVRDGGRLPLVLAGRPMAPALRALMAECPSEGRVIEAVDVGDEELNALYVRAACLLFPSLYEGFGWPVLEALTVGCPVICSNRASLPEVGGDAAIYINPDDEVEAAKVLQSFLESTDRHKLHKQKGFAQARRFSNETMLTKLLEQYQELCLV